MYIELTYYSRHVDVLLQFPQSQTTGCRPAMLCTLGNYKKQQKDNLTTSRPHRLTENTYSFVLLMQCVCGWGRFRYPQGKQTIEQLPYEQKSLLQKQQSHRSLWLPPSKELTNLVSGKNNNKAQSLQIIITVRESHQYASMQFIFYRIKHSNISNNKLHSHVHKYKAMQLLGTYNITSFGHIPISKSIKVNLRETGKK